MSERPMAERHEWSNDLGLGHQQKVEVDGAATRVFWRGTESHGGLGGVGMNRSAGNSFASSRSGTPPSQRLPCLKRTAANGLPGLTRERLTSPPPSNAAPPWRWSRCGGWRRGRPSSIYGTAPKRHQDRWEPTCIPIRPLPFAN